MDYSNVKRQTLMSDYITARGIYDAAMQDNNDDGTCMAYIYRAGIIAGKREARSRNNRLGSKLTEAHKEIKALREQVEMLSGIIRYNIAREVAEDERCVSEEAI